MKINRSTKCSLKYTTKHKQQELQKILVEYGRVVNTFINHFWNKKIVKREITKDIFNLPETWFSGRLKQVAAREAIDMIKSVKEVFEWNKKQIETSINDIETKIYKIKLKTITRKSRRRINNLHCVLKKKKMKLDMIQPHKPKHRSNRMCLSALIANLQECKNANNFNAWLHLWCIGNKITLDLPINYHKHFKDLNKRGKRLNSYVITKDYVQFCFEIETGKKKEIKTILGVDTGINALASTSNKEQLGLDIKACIERIKRCKWGSKGQTRARNALKQRISEVAKKVVQNTDLLVVEKLNNLNNNLKLKGRLSKNIRSSIGNWNWKYWLERLEMCCEDNRVSFRTVSPYNTSIECSKCGYTDRTNRIGELFKCRKCYHTDNADINAALNILKRFVTGKYGSCYKTIYKELISI